MWSMNERALGPKRTPNTVMPEHDEILSLPTTIANCRAAVRIVQFTDPQGAISLKESVAKKASILEGRERLALVLVRACRWGGVQGLDQSRWHHRRTGVQAGRRGATAECASHRSQRRQDREGARRSCRARSGGLCGSFAAIWLPDPRRGTGRVDIQHGRSVPAQEHGHAAGLCSPL
jgi:hypothetical protein